MNSGTTFPAPEVWVPSLRENNATDVARNGVTMATISREIELQVSPHVAGDTWAVFLRRVISGQYKLVCSEFACLNAVDSGIVSFAPVGDNATRVTFQLDIPDDGPAVPEDELARHMTHDLILFKDYVERHEAVPSLEERIRLEKDADAHGDKPRHVTPSTENDTTFWRSHFPT